MANLHFWQDETEVIVDDEGNDELRLQWFCSDGISVYFGNTKAEAASHFGVPVGDFGDDKSPAAVALGRKGGQAKSPRKAASSRENGKKGGRGHKKNKE